MKKSRASMPNMNFEKLLAKGENPLGFTAQTANGTAHYRGAGWNRDFAATWQQLPFDATRPAGKSNRTGE